MARSHYTYEKRQIELKKKKKKEEKLLKKQDHSSETSHDAAEYLAMLRGEPFEIDEENEENPDANIVDET